MLLIVLGRLAQFFIMLLTLRLASTYLTPDDLGKMAIITTAMALLSSLLINPVGMYVNRQLHTWNSSGDVGRYLGVHGVYVFVMALCSAFMLSGMHAVGLLNLHFETSFVFIFVFLSLFFSTLNQTTIPSLNMLGFRGWFTILSVGTLVLSLMFAVMMVFCLEPSAAHWLLGLLFGQLILGFLGAWVLFKNIKPSSWIKTPRSWIDVKTIFKFGWPIALTVGLTWFQSQSYRFFIEDALGLSTLGFFVAGYGMSAGIIAGFESIFTTYFQPDFYKKISQGNAAERAAAWSHYAQCILPTLIVVCVVLALLAPILTSFILAPTFQPAAKFLAWGAFIESCRVGVNVYSMAVYAEKNTKMLILPNAMGAVVSLLLMYCLMPKFGIVGVGLALGASGFLVMALLHLFIKKHHAITLPYEQIGFALIFCCFLCGFHYLVMCLMQSMPSLFLQGMEVCLIGIVCLIFERFLLKDVWL